MTGILWWLAASFCWTVVFSAGFWLGHGLARRKYAPPDPLTWDKHVDTALQSLQDDGELTPAEWMRRYQRVTQDNLRYLRDRRDRIN